VAACFVIQWYPHELILFFTIRFDTDVYAVPSASIESICANGKQVNDKKINMPRLCVAEIRRRCCEDIFQQGTNMLSMGNVIKIQIERQRLISANVLSFKQDMEYTVLIDYLHWTIDTSQDVYCSCPTFQSKPSRNLCVHMIATLMYIQNSIMH